LEAGAMAGPIFEALWNDQVIKTGYGETCRFLT
jgi:hypothetical protein